MNLRSILKSVFCLFAFFAAGALAQEELNLYIWSEYIDPEIITAFEKEFNCKVVVSLYESNEEMLAKLQAGGVSQYDLVVPSDFIMPSLIQLGLLQPIDRAAVPNIKNLNDNFVNPPSIRATRTPWAGSGARWASFTTRTSSRSPSPPGSPSSSLPTASSSCSSTPSGR